MRTASNMAQGLAIVVLFSLSACFVPNKYEATLSISKAGDVRLFGSGELQFFPPTKNPNKWVLKEKEIAQISKTISKTEGVISYGHINGHHWSVELSQTVTAKAWPKDVFGEGLAKTLWLPHDTRLNFIKVERQTPKRFLVTIDKFNKKFRAWLIVAGYNSKGVFKIKTPGKLVQTSGPKLSKSLFGDTYATDFDLLNDPPLKFTITLN